LPVEVRSGALRLKPSLRVRWHGRSRLPDLAVALALATTALFFGASFMLPPDSHADSRRLASEGGLVEVRSAASGETLSPVRTGVRIVDPDIARGALDWPIRTNAH
jgi:hypothetical protein